MKEEKPLLQDKEPKVIMIPLPLVPVTTQPNQTMKLWSKNGYTKHTKKLTRKQKHILQMMKNKNLNHHQTMKD